MEEKRYIISDAASLVKVETHVLRYWEEELELKIPRNELGHRYYTQKNIEEFQRIKELKEQGYQLKAIKALIHSKDEVQEPTLSAQERTVVPVQEILPVREEIAVQPVHTKVSLDRQKETTIKQSDCEQNHSIERFQLLMNAIVKNAIVENNTALGKEVTRQVAERILKEMNYLARTQDEQEEERYRKLDEAIRANQKGRKSRKEKKQENGKRSLRPKLTT